jgi:hypothetical protein
VPPPRRRRPAQDAKARTEAERTQRTDGRHCPVCLHELPRIAGARKALRCAACGAQPLAGRRCARCHRETVWQAQEGKAACQGCGDHGSALRVVAGALED